MTDRAREAVEVSSWPGIGPAKVRALLRDTSAEASVIDAARATWPDKVVPDAGAAILTAYADQGIDVLALGDPEYPAQLSQISDAPPLLYVKGSVGALTAPGVAVVGMRKASEDGRKAARVIAKTVVRLGFSVVSGLALGIDQAAHEAALEAGGITVAVLAHGLHTVAPASNKDLAATIIQAGGALVAEHPPGVSPRGGFYVQRNRIQTGLSEACVVVETSVEGGTMHTARFAHEQGRPLIVAMPLTEGSKLDRSGGERAVAELGARAISGTRMLRELLESIEGLRTGTSLRGDAP